MRKTLLFSTILLAATSVWAFGGVFGGGHKSHHSSGVSSIGVHIDANGDNTTPDITLVEPECNVDEDCDPNARFQTCVNGVCENVCGVGFYNADFGDYSSCAPTKCCFPVSSGNCSKNADCSSGEYCAIEQEETLIGSCQSIADNILPVSWHGQSFVRTKEQMSWWSVDNFCRAQGRHMVHLKDLGMTRPEGWCDGQDGDCCGLTPEEWTNLVQALQLDDESAPDGMWVNENIPNEDYEAPTFLEAGGAIGDYGERWGAYKHGLCK